MSRKEDIEDQALEKCSPTLRLKIEIELIQEKSHEKSWKKLCLKNCKAAEERGGWLRSRKEIRFEATSGGSSKTNGIRPSYVAMPRQVSSSVAR